jgi:very-short-patch-repair endonuclease
MSNDLAYSILSSLREKPRQTAREISAAIGHERNEVNSLLYGILKSKVEQDHAYRWSLKITNTSKPEIGGDVVKDTPLARLCRYYLDCIGSDDEGGVSLFAESKFSPTYLELSNNPIKSETVLGDAIRSEIGQKLISGNRKDNRRLNLAVGFPCCLKKVVSRKGWEGMMLEPLFIIPATQPEGSNRGYVLDFTGISINFPLVARLSGSSGVDEGLMLMSELGLGEGIEIEWDELLNRLEMLRPNWPWVEKPDFNNAPNEEPIFSITRSGIYNRSILFAREQSIYTQGLEKELAKLQGISEESYSQSALGKWVAGNLTSKEDSADQLIEVVPLNSEQRTAVRGAFSSPITVITGPPGTGKSQVVTSILVNAAWRGQKVLFASKNNRAVDVVETRVNSLGSRPILLRLGADKIRAALADYLLGLLSSHTSQEDVARYEENLKIYNGIQEQITKAEKDAETTIEARNRVDQLEQHIEPLREYFGHELFTALRTLNISLIREGVTKLSGLAKASNRSEQNWWNNLMWIFIRKERWRALFREAKKLQPHLAGIGIELPSETAPELDLLEPWHQAIENTQNILLAIAQIQEYNHALNQLGRSADLSELNANIQNLTEQKLECSYLLWKNWLSLQPSKLDKDGRRLLGDYAAILQLIVRTNDTGQTIGRDVFKQYYKLFPKIVNLLPCWAITSLSANGRIPLETGFFDLVVIDEASQCDIASALPLLLRAKKAVIIGDPNQLKHISGLPPMRDRDLMRKHELTDKYMGWSYSVTSVFDLASSLCSSDQIVVLRDHHRSHSDIIEFSNQVFYDNKLRVATRTDRLKPISPKETGMRWIPAEGRSESHPAGGSINRVEAEVIIKELHRVLVEQRYQGTVGVVTPFRAQANLIKEMMHKENQLSLVAVNADLIVDTAHGFQGDERDVMLFSPVVAQGLSNGSMAFLSKTPNVFNVAVTRARSCLIVVGSIAAVGNSGISHLEKFAQYYNSLVPDKSVVSMHETDLGENYPQVAKPELVSDWERLFYKQMYRSGIRAIPQYNIDNYILDFALIKGDRRLDIEVDGELYHRNWDGELIIRDRLRNHRMIELGWDVMRFWVYQIRDEPEACIDKINQWLSR